jgi:hypothetical protein
MKKINSLRPRYLSIQKMLLLWFLLCSKALEYQDMLQTCIDSRILFIHSDGTPRGDSSNAMQCVATRCSFAAAASMNRGTLHELPENSNQLDSASAAETT